MILDTCLKRHMCHIHMFGKLKLQSTYEARNEDSEEIMKRLKSNKCVSELDDSLANLIGIFCEQHQFEDSEVIEKIKKIRSGYAGFYDLTHNKCYNIDEVVQEKEQANLSYLIYTHPDEWILLIYDTDTNCFYIWQQNL